ncbi:unnamed protein product [Symbiodinium natans]|uniref:Uncharacterized protein n=1 Tax=Symbiodinium natans TaxID=878477 RepID=A0A812IFU6_9DINO|nr:unnamed protein product [Symbiodinium natans]
MVEATHRREDLQHSKALTCYCSLPACSSVFSLRISARYPPAAELQHIHWIAIFQRSEASPAQESRALLTTANHWSFAAHSVLYQPQMLWAKLTCVQMFFFREYPLSKPASAIAKCTSNKQVRETDS